jgi:hypothetical protein
MNSFAISFSATESQLSPRWRAAFFREIAVTPRASPGLDLQRMIHICEIKGNATDRTHPGSCPGIFKFPFDPVGIAI